MTTGPCLAVDLGTLVIKVAVDPGVTPVTAADAEVIPVTAPPGGPRVGVRAALATARADGAICLAVPDAWLAGEVPGAAAQEDVRHECEDVAGTGPVIWAGQLAAVSAYAALLHGPARYLVCDVGGTGVRAGVFAVADGTVRNEATRAEAGGGWLDFDAALRAKLGPGLPADWYEQVAEQNPKAYMVFEDAARSPAKFMCATAYRIIGPAGDVLRVSAQDVTDSFAPTLQRLREAVAAVLGGTRPGRVVFTGPLSWLPLAQRAIANSAGAEPEPLGLCAAARGALLFARGEARLAPPAGCEPVFIPAHRMRDGLLEEVSVPLPWTEPFAAVPGGAVRVDREELDLTVAGQFRTVRLPGLTRGPHRIGLRPASPGPGVLVVRAVTGDGVHIIPLSALAAR
jgi:hypothetical protein